MEKKTTHTAGTKSFARTREDLVLMFQLHLWRTCFLQPYFCH